MFDPNPVESIDITITASSGTTQVVQTATQVEESIFINITASSSLANINDLPL